MLAAGILSISVSVAMNLYYRVVDGLDHHIACSRPEGDMRIQSSE